MPTDPVELHHRFAYHPPATTEVAHQHEDVREACWRVANFLNGVLPEGREKSLAFTHLEETMMWANAAIARANASIITVPPDMPS